MALPVNSMDTWAKPSPDQLLVEIRKLKDSVIKGTTFFLIIFASEHLTGMFSLAQALSLSCYDESKFQSTSCHLAKAFPRTRIVVCLLPQWKDTASQAHVGLWVPFQSLPLFTRLSTSLMAPSMSSLSINVPLYFLSTYPFALFSSSLRPPFQSAVDLRSVVCLCFLCEREKLRQKRTAWGMAELYHCDGAEGRRCLSHYWRRLSGATQSYCLPILVPCWPLPKSLKSLVPAVK